MNTRITCTACSRRFEIPLYTIGLAVRCPHCDKVTSSHNPTDQIAEPVDSHSSLEGVIVPKLSEIEKVDDLPTKQESDSDGLGSWVFDTPASSSENRDFSYSGGKSSSSRHKKRSMSGRARVITFLSLVLAIASVIVAMETFGGDQPKKSEHTDPPQFIKWGNPLPAIEKVHPNIPKLHEYTNGIELPIRDVAFQSNGMHVATAQGENGKAGYGYLYSAPPIKAPLCIVSQAHAVRSVAFHPKKRLIALARGNRGLLLHNLTTEAGVPLTESGDVLDVEFSPNGKIIAVLIKRQLSVWHVKTRKRRWAVPAWRIHRVADDLPRICFSPDGTRIVVGTGNSQAFVVDANNGRRLRVLRGHSGNVTCAAYSSDGKFLATGDSKGVIHIRDASSYHPTGQKFDFKVSVRCIEFASDAITLGAAFGDGVVRMLNVESGFNRATFQPHTDAMCVTFSSDGQRMATSGSEGKLFVWDVTRFVGPAVRRE